MKMAIIGKMRILNEFDGVLNGFDEKLTTFLIVGYIKMTSLIQSDCKPCPSYTLHQLNPFKLYGISHSYQLD